MQKVFAKTSTYIARFFLFKLKNSETSQIFFNRASLFRIETRHSFSYPDNIMPLLIYRKSIRETSVYAKAETEAKAKSFILKNGETTAFALAVNFAINI